MSCSFDDTDGLDSRTLARGPHAGGLRPFSVASGQCPLCRSRTDRVAWREGAFTSYACDCGLSFTDPAPGPGEVDFTDDVHPDSFYALPAQRKADWLVRKGLQGRLLEVGCGRGYFLAAASRRGFEIHGMEPHEERARDAESRLGVPIERTLLWDHRLEPSNYDVVFHIDLLSHFPDPAGALRTMAALLRPGGVLAFEVGILGGVSRFWYHRIGYVGLRQHIYLYSERALAALLERAGLEIVAMDRFGLGLPMLVGKCVHLGLAVAGRVLSPFGDPLSVDWRRSVQQRLAMSARYHIGSLMPRLGPRTCFVIARPC